MTDRPAPLGIDERNAIAITQNLTELRDHYEERITSLENEVHSLTVLVTNQSRVLGETIVRMMGHGSTENVG